MFGRRRITRTAKSFVQGGSGTVDSGERCVRLFVFATVHIYIPRSVDIGLIASIFSRLR